MTSGDDLNYASKFFFRNESMTRWRHITDFGWAFDTIDHDILLVKLDNIFTGIVQLMRFCWIRRKDYVFYVSFLYCIFAIASLAPQGPPFFTIHISDLLWGLECRFYPKLPFQALKLSRAMYHIAETKCTYGCIKKKQYILFWNRMHFNFTKFPY